MRARASIRAWAGSAHVSAWARVGVREHVLKSDCRSEWHTCERLLISGPLKDECEDGLLGTHETIQTHPQRIEC